MNIKGYEAFIPAIIFVCINLIIITIVVTLGKTIINSLSFTFFIQIAFTTFVYTLFQFFHMFLQIETVNLNGYTFYHLCVLFVYLVIVTSISLMGLHKKLN